MNKELKKNLEWIYFDTKGMFIKKQRKELTPEQWNEKMLELGDGSTVYDFGREEGDGVVLELAEDYYVDDLRWFRCIREIRKRRL